MARTSASSTAKETIFLADKDGVASLAQPFEPPTASRAGQYLTFRIGRTDLAMRADRIAAFLPLNQLVSPDEAAVHADVTDLGGFAMSGGLPFPVIHLGRRLGLRKAPPGRNPYIVVVQLFRGEERYLSGFVADVVSDIVTARARDLHGGTLHTPGRPRRVIDPEEFLRWG